MSSLRRHVTPLGLGLVLLAVPGCALTSKSDPLEIRYFTPAEAPPPSGAPAGDGARLRLGRLSASDHLRQRIVVRTSAVELAALEDRRWTEKPEDYLRRALARALFEQAGLVHAIAGAGPTLDVELLAFEEVRRGDDRAAAVAMHVALHDDRVVLDSTTVRVEVPLEAGTDATAPLAQAMGSALDQATRQIATRVATRLARSAQAPATAATSPSPAP